MKPYALDRSDSFLGIAFILLGLVVALVSGLALQGDWFVGGIGCIVVGQLFRLHCLLKQMHDDVAKQTDFMVYGQLGGPTKEK